MSTSSKSIPKVSRGLRVLPTTTSSPSNDAKEATSANAEREMLLKEIAQIEEWWRDPRWKGTKRTYSAADVASLRNSLEARTDGGSSSSDGTTNSSVSSSTNSQILSPKCSYSHRSSRKLYHLLTTLHAKGGYSHTFGALDPVQVVQMAPHLSSIYISGWQCSSTASTTNEPGPDFADYPMNTVPMKCDQLVRAQLHHDRRQNEERASALLANQTPLPPKVDYLTPIIADGDTGHGGLSAIMKLTKLFVEAGAAGVHFEDQKPGDRKSVV